MKPITIVGLLLIALGILGFALGGVSFTHEKQDAKMAPWRSTTHPPRRCRSANPERGRTARWIAW